MQTLHATRCTLEPQAERHAAEMFGVLSDPAIYEFENEPPASVKALAERYRKLETRRSADGSEHWLNWVVRLPTGELAGYVQATVQPSGIAYVAYELASRHWRQGLGRSAVLAMLAELQSGFSVHTFVAVLKARNFRSAALLHSLGFAPAPAEVQARLRDSDDELVMCRAAEPLTPTPTPSESKKDERCPTSRPSKA